jgi:hypothetical protein
VLPTQGLPDDLRPSGELPLDIAGALSAAIARLATLEEEMGRCRLALVQLLDAIQARRA